MFNIVTSAGRITYSEVRTFMEKQTDIISKFKSITTYGNKTLIVTGNHLVYARKNSNDKFSPM